MWFCRIFNTGNLKLTMASRCNCLLKDAMYLKMILCGTEKNKCSKAVLYSRSDITFLFPGYSETPVLVFCFVLFSVLNGFGFHRNTIHFSKKLESGKSLEYNDHRKYV